MSMHAEYYLGPVAVVEVKRTDATESGCVNQNCLLYRQYNRTAFCSACGQTIGSFTVANRNEAVDRLKLFGGNETMWSAQSDDKKRRYYVPNVGRGAARKFGFDGDDKDQEITAETIAGELAWFAKAFAEEIEELRRAYGGIELKWMRFSYVM